jgi:hypothetical protein
MENQNVEIVENSKKGLKNAIIVLGTCALASLGTFKIVKYFKNKKNEQLDEVEVSEDSTKESK